MLTKKRQKQIIRDVMYGLPPGVAIESLDQDYQYLWGVVEAATNSYEAYDDLLLVKREEVDLAGIIDDILLMEPGDRQTYETLADIGPTLKEVEWFWENWVPKGLLTLLAAEAGVGKTNVALDLARRVIGGLEAPDGGSLATKSRNVIYIDAEGFLSVIYMRCKAWGMDLGKFYPLRRPSREMIDLNTGKYQDELIDMCGAIKPDLLIVDSLSTISLKGENSIEDMREILNYLADLAASFNLAIMLIHHLRKESNTNTRLAITQNDLRGSGHIAMMSRSLLGLHMATAGDPNGPRKLRVLKTNLCPYPKPLVMAFIPSPNDPAVSLVDYGEAKTPEIPENLTGECAKWLISLVKAHPRTYGTLCKLGAKNNYNETLIQAARKYLDWQIVDSKGPKVRGNKWMLYGWLPGGVSTRASTHGSHGPCVTPPPPKMAPTVHTWAM